MVIDCDRLIKNMVSRDPDRMHITTLGGGSVLLDPIKNVVQRRCFDKYCATRDGYRAKAFKPPRWTPTVLAPGQVGCTALTNCSLSTWTPPAPRLYTISTSMGRTWLRWGPHRSSMMDCVCKLCGAVDSQHYIIRDCTDREIAGTSTLLCSRGARVTSQLGDTRLPRTLRSTLTLPFRQARNHDGPAQGVQGAGCLRSGAPQDSTQADAGDEGGRSKGAYKGVYPQTLY